MGRTIRHAYGPVWHPVDVQLLLTAIEVIVENSCCRPGLALSGSRGNKPPDLGVSASRMHPQRARLVTALFLTPAFPACVRRDSSSARFKIVSAPWPGNKPANLGPAALISPQGGNNKKECTQTLRS